VPVQPEACAGVYALGRVSALSLLCALRPLDTAMVGKLLGWGANPNARSGPRKLTPLHLLLGAPPAPAAELSSVAGLLASFGARPELEGGGGSGAALLAARGVSVEPALQRWAHREEPQSVQALAMQHPYRIPFGAAPGQPGWDEDAAVKECRLCEVAFGVVVRKHHCRRCGKVVCAQCCSKTFSLKLEPAKPGAQPEMGKHKVCAPCFNSLSRAMTVAASEVSAVMTPGEAGRALLFGSRDAPAQAQQGAAPKQDAKQGRAAASSAKVQEALARAQESLAERGERLGRLAEQSDQLNNNAANFGDLARQLREREEKKAGWFGGFF
jgi:hypothetical protein